MHPRRDGEETRRKILDAACLVFGEKGYHASTHAEICQRAGVNTAAINFHFGCKDNLYRLTWDYLVKRVETICPLNGGVPSKAPVVERLHGHVRTMLTVAMDERFTPVHRILSIELLYPTGLLDDQVETKHQILLDYSEGLIRELLGEGATASDVAMCQMSFVAQWKAIRFSVVGQPLGKSWRFTKDDIEDLTSHVTDFCLAGIRDRRRRIAQRKAGKSTRPRVHSDEKRNRKK